MRVSHHRPTTTAERGAVLSTSGAAALTAPAGHDLRPRRLPALLVGAALACIATLALATLPASPVPGSHPLTSHPGLQSHATTRLPVGLAAAASASIGASERSFWPVRHGASLFTQGGAIHGTFTASGPALRVSQGTLGFLLAAVGLGRRVQRVTPVAPTGAANRVLYRHRSVTEFYRNGPYGLEQGFTLLRRPQAGTGSLVLALGLSGSLVPEQVGAQILFRTHAGATVLRYGQLSALDATGRRLPAHMHIKNRTLQLRIDDSHARYPLRIDPFIQQGEKLTGGNEESGAGKFGVSAALSSDGSTALIGAPYDGSAGAAWVFTRSGGVWKQQGSKFTGAEAVSSTIFGSSVALSSDGNTALIGGWGYNGSAGAAWVFTRSAGVWTQQGSRLTGGEEKGKGIFGISAALSSDGNTALIGGSLDNSSDGAAWVFTRSAGVWKQQQKLTAASASRFGESVALSSDGNTALIGGPTNEAFFGAAWVFTRSGELWNQQEKLTGAKDRLGEGRFGESVSLSSDGNTALIGGPRDNGGLGAAWVFMHSATWEQRGEKLTGGNEEISAGEFGRSVSLSGDGKTALIGGPADNSNAGAAWAFTTAPRTQLGAKLTGGGESGAGEFGRGVALAANGSIALLGGPADNGQVGAAWTFVNPPTVTAVSPKAGPEAGGTSVSITGTAFTGATAVKFGLTDAKSFTVNSDTSITAVSPAGTGTADIYVTTPAGTSSPSPADYFSYGLTITNVEPNSGPVEGGTSVSITGAGFTGATRVLFGSSRDAKSFTVNSDTSITAVSPPGAEPLDVRVTTPEGWSPTSPADRFTYGPFVTGLSPKAGPPAGGTSVSITGVRFTGATAVKFGENAAKSFTVNSDTSITAVSPARSGVLASAIVNVTTPEGGSPYSPAAVFEYGVAVTNVEPNNGPLSGGTSVKITGAGFTGATAVKFGSANATSFTVNSETSITAVSPAGTGTVDVTVTSPERTSYVSEADRFTYGPSVMALSPKSGPLAGGTAVRITGTRLTNASAVKFGSANATSFTVNSATQITAVSPPAGTGTVDVSVTTPEGTTPTSAADRFGYGLTVAGVHPNAGTQRGGMLVNITGTNFTGAKVVRFGSTNNTTAFTVDSDTSITAIAPGGSGTVDVRVIAPEGTSPTSPADRFTYGPTVTGVSPNAGPPAGGTQVVISGIELWRAIAVKFGSINASSISPQSGTEIVATAPAGTGTVDVTVTSQPHVQLEFETSATSVADRFTYGPSVNAVEPNHGPQAGGTSVTIRGEGLQGATAVRFGSSNASSFTVNSGTQITAVAPAGTGRVDVTVTTPEGTDPTSAADRFTYGPSVNTVQPNSGPQAGGTSVSITGERFTGATAVRFGWTNAASFTVNSDTSITAIAPPGGTGTVDVTVNTPEGRSPTGPPDQFSYGPSVTSMSTQSGAQAGGTPVSIIGTNLSGATAVRFGSSNASSFTVNSGTQITAVAPAGTGTVDVTVTTPEATSPASSADQFTYLPPTVTGLSPSIGPSAGGTSVIISGTAFTGATAVKFGSTNAASFKVEDFGEQITAVSPPGSGTVDVTVTTPRSTSPTSSVDQFLYETPIVTGVSPKEGPQAGGTSVTITGIRFTGATAVKFGSANAASFKVDNYSQITAVSPPAGTGTVDVTVTTPEGGTSPTSSADRFTYGPTVNAVNPNHGHGGTSVTISGSAFTGATAVKFGSTNATSFKVLGEQFIEAFAPAGTGTVDVTVTTPEGTSPTNAADRYTYGASVNTVQPNNGPQAGGTSVSITGTGFTTPTGTTVKFGSSNATSFKVNSETSITAVSPAGTGTVDVTVTTPEGTSPTSSADQFKYVPPPTVLSEAASSVGDTSASLHASVNPNGGAVSDCHFEYGIMATYGSTAPCTPAPGWGESPVAVSASVASLSAGSGYHFRISATNPGGTSYGSDRTFQTPAAHYYRNNALVGSEPKPVISWGTFALKTLTGASGEVVCHTVQAGSIDNPMGGGAGVGATQLFATWKCESTRCPYSTVVTAEALPWPSVLQAEGSAIRARTTVVKIKTDCQNEGSSVGSETLVGTSAPSSHSGTSALHPTFFEFDAGAGGLEAEGSQGSVVAVTEGEVKTLGYEEQELITTKEP